jgi:hypothetical protein
LQKGSYIGTEKVDIECDDTIASNYDQNQKAVCLGYVNPLAIAQLELIRKQHE